MNPKPLLVLQGPLATRSGYGDKTRDLIRMLIELDKYEIRLVSTAWGACPMNALSSDRDKDIIDKILPQPVLDRQPDVFIQVDIPSNFTRIGKVNIGYTAGIETTLCSEQWIHGCNRMDYVWVVSEHAKRVFADTKIEMMTPEGTVAKTVVVTKSIEIVPNAVNPKVYKKISAEEINLNVRKVMSNVKENFCFLFVGHWLKGDIGEDRKNVGLLIKIFGETFKNTISSKRPALILKTSGADFSILDQEEILKKIKAIKQSVGPNCPKIYFIHGDLTEDEMNSLYNHPKVKAHVSFTKGEGFGRPLLEATMSQKPVIASGWSGQLDFLNKDDSVLVSGELRKIEAGAVWENVLIPESQWFNVDHSHAASALMHVFKNYDSLNFGLAKLARRNREVFGFDAVKKKVGDLLDNCVEAPTFMPLQLPELTKVGV
jgi:glycosyltransferase involved in cell wall biosynthesis